MLFMSLVLSALLLVLSNWIVWRSHHAISALAFLTIGALICPILLFCVAPAVMLQSLLLLVAAVLWRRSGSGAAAFFPYSLGATVVAYGLAGILVFMSEREYARLRLLHPYESIEDRLPALKSDSPPPPVSSAGNARMGRLEERVGWGWYRERQLRMLHEDALGLFVNSPGFGISRLGLPSGPGLVTRLEPVPPQPGPRVNINWSPGDLGPIPQRLEQPIDWLLDASIVEFIDPRALGYVKDRRHVSGFEAHRFRREPQAAGLRVQRLELVSLLLHDEPVVYDSAELPRMDRVRETPSRALDRFERHGLDSLREGEDIVFAETPEGVRMLGAVRSLKPCIACHGGSRGQLLGAFSYALR
jgi:hypothetical protein